MGEVDDPPPTQAPCGNVVSRCGCTARLSPQKINTAWLKHVVLTEKWDYYAEQRLRHVFLRIFRGFLRILNRRQDKERSFRGRIQSNEMRNMILTALLLVHLPTGEALKAL